MSELTPEMRDDLIFLRETMRWPAWPYLPVKNSKKDLIGILFDFSDEDKKKGIYVAEGNLISFAHGEMEWKDMPKHHYKDHVEMLLDGWMVD